MRFFILLFSLTILGHAVWAQDASSVRRSHGFTVLGEPALPADFRSFPYVNVDAPKGGEVHLAEIGTFDSFNPFILRGTAEAHGDRRPGSCCPAVPAPAPPSGTCGRAC